MLQYNSREKKAFEVAVYNREVRAAVKDNRSHAVYGDHWADVQIQDVVAHNEKEAWDMIEDRWPTAEGFVVEGLKLSGFE